MSGIEVCIVEGKDEERVWQEYVKHSEKVNFFHLIDWKDILSTAYGYEPFYFIAREGDVVRGIFPIFLVKSLLFGRALKSLPFQFLGGPVCDSDEVLVSFFTKAKELCEEHDASYLEFKNQERYDNDRYHDLRVSRTYTSFVTPLSNDHDKVFSSFKENIRRFIKKSAKEIEVRVVESQAGLKMFYQQYCWGMREIGIPPHSYFFFNELFRRFAGKKMMRITLAFYQNKPIASLLTLIAKKRILFWWGVRDFHFRNIPSTHALHWESIKWGCEHDYDYYDFGMTSPVEESAMVFKSRWGTFPVQQFFYRMFDSNPIDYDCHTHFKMSRTLWKYVPLPLVRTIGPFVARQVG